MHCFEITLLEYNLRFSGFDGEWKTYKLKDITERITRKNPNLESNLVLTISAEHGLINQEEFFYKIVASKNLKNYYLIKNGEFAYNKSYSKSYPYGAIKRLENYSQGVLSSLYICFKPTKVNSDFLKEYFETSYWYKEIYSIAVEGARNHGLLNININDFFNTKHSIPSSNEEQQKIADLFKIINSKINLLKQKKEEYQNFKKYLMQQIFAQKLRFDDFDEDWETYKLKELCSIIKGKQLNKENMLENAEYYVLNGGIEPSGFTDEWNTLENTISISEGGNSCGYVNFNTEKFWSGGHCYTLNSLESNLNAYYLFSYLKSIESKIMRLRVGSGLPNIQKRDIELIQIQVPELKEQEKIANFLLNLDIKITETSKQIYESKKFKKGLLQQMFI